MKILKNQKNNKKSEFKPGFLNEMRINEDLGYVHEKRKFLWKKNF